jgi:hypothetical protein
MKTKKLYKIDSSGNLLGEETVLANEVYSLLGSNLDFKDGDVIVNFLFTEISPPQISGTQTLNFNNGEWVVVDGPEEVEQKELDEREKERNIKLEQEKKQQEASILRQKEEEEKQRQIKEQYERLSAAEFAKQQERLKQENNINEILSDLEKINTELNN